MENDAILSMIEHSKNPLIKLKLQYLHLCFGNVMYEIIKQHPEILSNEQ